MSGMSRLVELDLMKLMSTLLPYVLGLYCIDLKDGTKIAINKRIQKINLLEEKISILLEN